MADAKFEFRGREYAFPEKLTAREWGVVKSIAHVTPSGIPDALKEGDVTVIAALLIVAKRRAGDAFAEDEVLDARPDEITVIGGDKPDDEVVRPPEPAPAHGD